MPRCFKPYHTSDGNVSFTAKQLTRQHINTRLDVMRTWFLENYCDPVHCCPYDSSEGGYDYIWGGPYAADEILYSEFDREKNDELINHLADELSWESPNWSPIPSSEDDFLEYLPKETKLSDIYDEFKNSVKNIEALLSIKNIKNHRQYLYRLIYANIITALEAYLWDTFVKLAIDNLNIRMHYMLYHAQKNNTMFKKIRRSETLSSEQRIKDKMYLSSRIVWHRLEDVEELFEKVLNISFIDYRPKLKEPIKNRHDIVHRNGKTVDGALLNITKKDIRELSVIVKRFVLFLKKEIDKNLKKSNAKKIDDTYIEEDVDFY